VPENAGPLAEHTVLSYEDALRSRNIESLANNGQLGIDAV